MSFPLLYEINTRCWLRELSSAAGRALTLADVPESEIASWSENGFTHVWLMGVWKTGAKARNVALSDANSLRSYSEALPDWRPEDVGGSPFAVAVYQVAEELGGDPALAAFRRRLKAAGMGLVLDFIPNHVGLDHPWIQERTDLFVQSPKPMPESFMVECQGGMRWLAHGKDPNFPAWSETAQLDYRNPATREAMIGQLHEVAERCDGVRCDMAMLQLNETFARQWSRFPFAHPMPEREFWTEAIAAVWRQHPDFLFLAESYWGLESALQTLGFDYVYDKILYDELAYHDPSAVTRHLYEECSASFIENSIHFLENHDELRAASIFIPEECRAAALLTLGLPGLRLLHEGQMTGARVRTPAQLLRRPQETVDREMKRIYAGILRGLKTSSVGHGTGRLLRPRPAWPENQTWRNLVIVLWEAGSGEFDLVIVNLVPHRCQCLVPLNIRNLASHHWSMRDVLGPEHFFRVGADLVRQGLYLDVCPYAAQIFHFQPGL